MPEPQSIPWEQQALHIAIDTIQEVLPQKPKEQQEALHMSLMTLRGFLAATSSIGEDDGGASALLGSGNGGELASGRAAQKRDPRRVVRGELGRFDAKPRGLIQAISPDDFDFPANRAEVQHAKLKPGHVGHGDGTCGYDGHRRE